MPENTEVTPKTDEMKKLSTIAADMDLNSKMRSQAIDRIGEIGSYEALLILLGIVANEKLGFDERDLALKRARDIVKKSR